MAAHTSANPTFPFGQSIVWQPDPAQVAQTNLAAFMARHGIATYDDLLRARVDDVGWFWDAVLADLGIEFYRPYTTVFDPTPGIAYPTLVCRRRDEHRPQLPGQVAGDGRPRSARPCTGRARRAEQPRSPTPNWRRRSTAAPMPCAALASARATPSGSTCP